ncbi:unnamed protein product [Peronospora belbahrii]|uniref:Uncharacterized protein n=1 Tax=Peronospora belbahrii TaxID=622444 RepID=A0AAU9KS31_9STRA|nr:unnamed protein product [Peronospora belbahrii]
MRCPVGLLQATGRVANGVRILGSKGVEHLISQGEEEVRKRIHMLDEYNKALVEHVKAQMPSSSPLTMATMAQEVVRRPTPIQMEVDKFDGKEGDSLMLWFRQVDLALTIADISYELYRVGFSTVKLDGLAKLWAFTCDPLPEAVTVTVFMEGLRVGVARMEVFRVNTSSFEEAVGVAWNAETNFDIELTTLCSVKRVGCLFFSTLSLGKRGRLARCGCLLWKRRHRMGSISLAGERDDLGLP